MGFMGVHEPSDIIKLGTSIHFMAFIRFSKGLLPPKNVKN